MNTFNYRISPKLSWSIIGLMFSFMLLTNSCKKDDTSQSTPNQPTPTPDEYYVRYIVSSSTIYMGGKLNVTITNEKNQSITVLQNWNTSNTITIGPVSKGFNARLRVVTNSTSYDKLKIYTEIQVSKNNSPFVMKAIDGSDAYRDIAQLNYTIDY